MDKRRTISSRKGEAHAESGLTLVELLVVLTILAFAASVVILNAPPSRPPARDAAERFAVRIQSALDAAVVEGGAWRLEVQSSEYRIARYDGAQWTSVVRENAARDGFSFRVELAEAAADNSLALDGERQGENGEEEWFVAPLDPFAGGLDVNAHFESRRGDWTVAIGPEGAVKVTRR